MATVFEIWDVLKNQQIYIEMGSDRMLNILDTITAELSALNTSIGLGGSLTTIFDHFKSKTAAILKKLWMLFGKNRAWPMRDTANTESFGRRI